MSDAKPVELTPLQRSVVALERMKQRLDRLEAERREPIAIVGMACRFPGASDGPDALWSLVRDGRDGIREVPPERWPVPPATERATSEQRAARWGGFLGDVSGFDADFFRLSPREVACMDPQQRLLLEVAWEALENAGVRADRLVGAEGGVFLGVMNTDYATHLITHAGPDGMDLYTATGNGHHYPAGRLSYQLGWRGPSLVVDTACSSSLVALHLAVESLRRGECDIALAGGVSLMLVPETQALMARMQVLSPDGRCHTFDARANGIVRGEGCGILVLKRLADAAAARDPVVALVRGSAVNQDGRSAGLTVPSATAQEAVIRRALAVAGVAADDVGFVEMHGTGTPLGDPIEFEALSAVYGASGAAAPPCALGAVKTNIGHTEAAAGVAGVMKAALALRHGTIPPNLNFAHLNPRIPLVGTRFRVPTESLAWPSGAAPRRAAVSSFGMSGTNAHAILEEAPAPPEAPRPAGDARVLPVSAASAAALAQACARFADWLDAGGDAALADACYTASCRRSHLAERAAATGRTAGAVAAALRACAEGLPHPNAARGRRPDGEPPGVVFVFPGHGSQWLGMGRELMAEPVFAERIRACDAGIRELSGWSLLEELDADPSRSRLGENAVVQPALFALQIALAGLWRAWSIAPDAVVGHSMGEVAAAHVAGALELDDALRIICRRSEIAGRRASGGGMVMAELDGERALRAIEGHAALVSVAAENSPRATLLSGDRGALQEIVAKLEEDGVFCRWINVDYASHSPQMDPLAGELREALAGVRPRTGEVPIYSTVRGAVLDGSELDAGYWVRNLREPVRFVGAMRRLVDDGHGLFVELAPHPILLPAMDQTFREWNAAAAAVPSMRREQGQRAVLLGSVAVLYSRGADVDWDAVHGGAGRTIALPNYPWQRSPHWFAGARAPLRSAARAAGGAAGWALAPVAGRSDERGVHVFEGALADASPELVADHRVGEVEVVPAALHVEWALRAAREALGPRVAGLRDVLLRQPLVPIEGADRTLQAVVRERDGGGASYRLASRADGDAEWTRHVEASIELGDRRSEESAAESVDTLRLRCAETVDPQALYAAFDAGGLHYGARFRLLREIGRGEGEAYGRLAPAEPAPAAGGEALDAARFRAPELDAALQLLAVAAGEGPARIPARIGRVRVGDAAGELAARARIDAREEDGSSRGSVALIDAEGHTSVSLEDVALRPLAAARAGAASDAWFHELRWIAAERPAAREPRAPGAWLLLSRRDALARALEAELAARGASVVHWPEPDGRLDHDASAEELASALAGAFDREHPCRGVVHLQATGSTQASAASADAVLGDARRGLRSLLHVCKALAATGWRDAPDSGA